MLKIKEVIGLTALVSGDQVREDEYQSNLTRYDKNEKVIEYIDFTSDGEIENKTTFLYDEKGNLLEETHFVDEEEVSEVMICKRNEDGKIVSMEINYADGSKTIKQYERIDNTETIIVTDEDGEFDGKETRVFDANNHLLEYTRVDYNNKVEQRFVYEYDSNGLVLSIQEYASGNQLFSTTKSNYDEKGNPIKVVVFAPSGKVIKKVESQFNEQGDPVSEKYNDKYVVNTEYDEKGNDTKQETINLLTGLTEVLKNYHYDENGMLVEEVSFSVGQEYHTKPGVLAKSLSSYLSTIYQYKFYED